MKEDSVFSTISQYVRSDYERVLKLFCEFERLLKYDIETANEVYHQFDKALRRHIRLEDSLLFPLYESYTNFGQDGPTLIMRNEHRVLEDLLNAISCVLIRDLAVDHSLRYQLKALLDEHNGKEEKMIYPAMDDLLSDEEIMSFLDVMRTEVE